LLSETRTRLILVASDHPAHWVAFIADSGFTRLLESVYDSDFVVAAAVLLRLGAATLENALPALRLLICSRSKDLQTALARLLLLHPDAVVGHLLDIFPVVSNAGSRSDAFFSFLSCLVPRITRADAVLQALLASLQKECQGIQRMPNSHIHGWLARFIDVSSSHLDPRSCGYCNNPEREPSKLSLGDCRDFAKCSGESIAVKKTIADCAIVLIEHHGPPQQHSLAAPCQSLRLKL
jgi:hypothetical protein